MIMAEALRRGRLIRPRLVRDMFFSGDDGACTLGAIAIGLDPYDITLTQAGFTDDMLGLLETTYPILGDIAECSVKGCKDWSFHDTPDHPDYDTPITSLIMHLADSHNFNDDGVLLYLSRLQLDPVERA